jgi:hypothetical protein
LEYFENSHSPQNNLHIIIKHQQISVIRSASSFYVNLFLPILPPLELHHLSLAFLPLERY